MKTKTLWITVAAVAGVAVAGGATAAAVAAPSAVPAPTASVVPTPTGSPSSASAATDADIARAVEAALAEVGAGQVLDVDLDDDSGHAYEIDVLLDAGATAEVHLDADFEVVSVQRDDRGGEDRRVDTARGEASAAPVSGADAARAAEAALAHVGSGTVVEVDRDDDPGVAWEVEIELPDGEDVDVELDADFRVVSVD